MKTAIKNFNLAYDDFEKAIEKYAVQNIRILEVGGGAFPSIENHAELDYTIIDPDKAELNKSKAINKIHSKLENWETDQKFDLIVSKMVLEHIPNPFIFHEKILHLLTPKGKVLHLFACRNSLPAVINRFLPESFGDSILRIIKNRNLNEEPKYKAYYLRTNGPTSRDIDFYTKIGFNIEVFNGYVGHNYLHAVPLLRNLENLYSSILSLLKFSKFATVSVILLEKNDH